ncbi:MAG TPA: Yip1 family protein [Croceibacterium sp.]|nr:Yip1 family protein [Croceibacterium sp.]
MDDTAKSGGSAPGLAVRAKAILKSPTTEWPKIASESDSVQSVFTSYVVPLAAIGPICGFIGGQLFGVGVLGFRYHPTLIGGLATAITTYVLALVSVFLIAWVANFLADKFGGQQNFARAFKLCAYALTAGWVAGVFNLLTSLSLLVFLASLYGIYLFYLGATPMMAVPQDKAAGYTAVTIVGVIIVGIIIAAVTAPIAAVFAPATAIGATADNGTVEMSVPGYGKFKVENNGSKQTLEVPGYGTVHVTKNGDTVKIDGPNVNAEVKGADAGK